GTVGVMAAPVGDLAARVVVDPAEIDVTAGRRVGGLGGGAEPEIVVEALGHGFGLLPVAGLAVVGSAAGQAATDRLQIADPAVADQLAGAAEIAVGTLLAAGLENAAMLLDRVRHGSALGDGQRERLLAINVLAGAGGGDDRDGVPVIRRANNHSVHVLARQQ